MGPHSASPMMRRHFLRATTLTLGGLGLADLLRLRPRRGSRTIHAGYVRHPAVAAGRAAAHGNLRHEAGRPGRVSRRFQADPHQRARPRRLRAAAAARPRRRQVHPHPLHAHTISPTTAAARSASSPAATRAADRLRQRSSRWSARWSAKVREGRTSACRTTSPAWTRAAGHRRLQLRLGLPGAVARTRSRRRRSQCAEVRGQEPGHAAALANQLDDRRALLHGFDDLRREPTAAASMAAMDESQSAGRASC